MIRYDMILLKTITLFFVLNCCMLILACESQKVPEMKKYINETETRLTKIEHEILALRERADNWGTLDKVEFEAQIDNLSEKETVASQGLEELRKTNARNWRVAKAEMDSLMQAVEKAYSNTRDW